MHDLTAFQRDVLYVIAGAEAKPHGLAIKDKLTKYYDNEIDHARLYPNLDTLVDKGLVEKGTIDRRTNSYTLSERGKQKIASRREWENENLDNQLTGVPTP